MAIATIKLRRDTLPNWELNNPMLSEGEVALVTDIGGNIIDMKIGNGLTKFSSTTYYSPSGLQSQIDGKVDDYQVLTNVPLGAVFTDTVFTKPLSEPISYIVDLQATLDGLVTKVAGASLIDDLERLKILSDIIGLDSRVNELYSILESPDLDLDTLLEIVTFIKNNKTILDTLTIGNISGLQSALDLKAPLASPALTGVPTAPTAVSGTNTTQVATTAFVEAKGTALQNNIDLKAPLASPALTGTPTAPTAVSGTNTTQVATTAFVTARDATLQSSIDLKAPLASPALTGTPTAPTAISTTNTTQVATTEFVTSKATTLQSNVDLKAPLASPALTGVPTAPTAIVGTNTTQVATTAFVEAESNALQLTLQDNIDLKAPLASPALTGTPTAPTAISTTNTTQVATTAFVQTKGTALQNNIDLKAPLASPALTGTPTAPTALTGTSTTQVATTAFVNTNYLPLIGGTVTGSMVVNGVFSAGSIIETSSIRFKENVKPIEDPIEKMKQLNGVTYDWIATGKGDIGFIAEEVEKVLPELIEKEEDGTVIGMNYGKMTALLIEIVKSQQIQIDELKAMINGAIA